jgi:hypothetical protein
MNEFFNEWANAAYTSVGFFWMALWAFVLGYFLSSLIQVFLTEKWMQKTIGDTGGRSLFLSAFFGFISSSCSFSALATAKSLFKKGASFSSAIAFLLASTNLVIELGIVISIFLGWQFVVGEYVGGLLLIISAWLLIAVIRPNQLIEEARARLEERDEGSPEADGPEGEAWNQKKSWIKVGRQYCMEWKMVWKDVTIGFTVAGLVSAFVPDSLFQTLFIHTGDGQSTFGFFTLLQHVVVGPVAAFLTFIGSMGNIPLAALLYGKGVSFAGVMAFIFSDLVVFPVLRIHAKYYGWRMSLFILFLLFTSLIGASLALHYGFDFFDALPELGTSSIAERHHFEWDYSFFLNIFFLLLTVTLIYFGLHEGKDIHYHKEMASKSPLLEKILKWLAFMCYIWLIVGLVLKYVVFF